MAGQRRSLLHYRILSALKDGWPGSQRALADHIGAKRPAVSRSLAQLRERGLVVGAGRSWSVTPSGGIALAQHERDILAGQERLERRVERLRRTLG